eukprot:9262952-Pyramimonas_sp.AAC.1
MTAKPRVRRLRLNEHGIRSQPVPVIVRRTVMHDKKICFGHETGLIHHGELSNTSLVHLDAELCNCPRHASGDVIPISDISARRAANVEENVECALRP